jgi:hypothetical protein
MKFDALSTYNLGIKSKLYIRFKTHIQLFRTQIQIFYERKENENKRNQLITVKGLDKGESTSNELIQKKRSA